MPRYIVNSRTSASDRRVRSFFVTDDVDLDDTATTAREIFLADGESVIDTGLVDQYGEPILRHRPRVKIGFVR